MLHNSKLDTLIIVAQTLSFTKAAEQLFITPSAVIRQINSLEEDYSIRIFDRTPRGLLITPEGNEFILVAKEIVSHAYETENQYLSSRTVNTIRICNSVYTPVFMLSEIFIKIKEKLPDLKMEFFPYDVDYRNRFMKTAYSIIGSQVDVILGITDSSPMPGYENLEITVLGKLRARIGMSVHNKLAEKKELVLSDLEGRTLYPYASQILQDESALESLLSKHPAINVDKTIRGFTQLNNICAYSDDVFLTSDIWTQANPLIVHRKIKWPVYYNYGAIHLKSCNDSVKAFISAIKKVIADIESGKTKQ